MVIDGQNYASVPWSQNFDSTYHIMTLKWVMKTAELKTHKPFEINMHFEWKRDRETNPSATKYSMKIQFVSIQSTTFQEKENINGCGGFSQSLRSYT